MFASLGALFYSGCGAAGGGGDATTTTTTGTGTTTTTVRTYTFTVSEIHTSGASAQYSNIAVDSNNKIHIVHYGTSSGVLYTTNASGSWVTTTIQNVAIANRVSMAIDSSDGLHVAYYYTNGVYDLRYAYKASGSSTWTIETVDSTGTVGLYNSIATDTNDKAHILYVDNTNSDIKYATNAPSGTWNTEVVDSTGVASSTSIILDGSNNVYIAYQQGNMLYYVTGTAGSWSSRASADSGIVFRNISMKLDSGNKAHISYYNSVGSELKHATNATGAWVDEVVPSAGIGSDGGYTSLAIDSSNNLFISYHKDYTSSGLSTACKVAYYVGGSWSIKEIKSGSEDANIGMYSSIALDSSGKMHVSFEEGNGSDLWYAAED